MMFYNWSNIFDNKKKCVSCLMLFLASVNQIEENQTVVGLILYSTRSVATLVSGINSTLVLFF